MFIFRSSVLPLDSPSTTPLDIEQAYTALYVRAYVFLPGAHLHGVPVANRVYEAEPDVLLSALARILLPSLDRVHLDVLCAPRERVFLVGLFRHVIVYHMISEPNLTHGANNALSLVRVELFNEEFDEGSLSDPGWPAHHDVQLPIPRESRGHLVDDIVNLIVYT